MIITVGTGKGVADGIWYSIDQHNPDYVYFLTSDEGNKITIPELQPRLEKGEITYSVFTTGEINDIDVLYEKYSDCLDEIIKKGYKIGKIIADFTSGTKAMSGALSLVGIFKEIGLISYVSGTGRDKATGRVISGTERISSFFPVKITVDRRLNLFQRFFNTYQYESALKILEDIKSLGGDYKNDVIETLSMLTKAYDSWDKFNFTEALDRFKELRNNEIISKMQLKQKIEKNKEFLSRENQNEYCMERLIDLYLNTERRITEGKYDDAMARLYRVFEYMAQLLLKRNNPAFITSDIDINKLPENIRKKYSSMKNEKGIVELGIKKSYELLKDLNNNAGMSVYKDYKPFLQKYLTQRNNSILAHGFNPVSLKSVSEFKEKLKKYMVYFDSNWQQLAEKGKFPQIIF